MASKPTNPSESTRALSAGLTFGITIALFAVGGIWLDKELDTRPLFVLIGVFVGLLGGTIHLLAALAPDTLPFGRKPRGAATPDRLPDRPEGPDGGVPQQRPVRDDKPSDSSPS